MKYFLSLSFGLVIFMTILLLPSTALSTIHNVSIGDFFFSPLNTRISVGDSVRWTNNGQVIHTSTSDNSVWDSGFLDNGQSFIFQFNTAGTFPYHCAVHPFMKDTIHVAPVGIIDEGPEVPYRAVLSQNYPNPFNASTIISYSLPTESNVQISIYDILGRQIEVLANEYQQPGNYQVTWNAQGTISGIYFYVISINGESQARKMLLIK